MNLKIFQVFHKDYPYNRNCSWITPIGVSGYTPENLLHDGLGLNISKLNAYYCELTVLYYIWKNVNASHVGLYHYRRYLNFKLDDSIFDPLIPGRKIYEPEESLINYLSDEEQKSIIIDTLKVYDVIIPRKSLLGPTIKQQYLSAVEHEPWCRFEENLNKKNKELSNASNFYEIEKFTPICNMLIMKKELFNKYCHDLFEIIDSIYLKIKHPYDGYNNRYPGFLAERYLGYWLHTNRISYAEATMIAMR